MPKLQIACATQVTTHVVQTASPKAKEAQRATLEFLLINHRSTVRLRSGGECYCRTST